MEYTTEELVINDSFINYCLGRNADDVHFWEEMMLTRPEMVPRMQEAAEIVLGLHVMLRNEVKDGDGFESLFREKKTPLYRRLLPYAAVLIAVAALAWFFRHMAGDQNSGNSNSLAGGYAVSADSAALYITRLGERKFFVLPDSTRIYLGAGSRLQLCEGFAVTNREVHLSGEALFDVPADHSRPFIVHSKGYDVNVLGTLFNVKAYPEEAYSETSLLRGKVEIALPGKKHRLPLAPNQKMIISKAGSVHLQHGDTAERISLQPLSYSAKDSAVIETVWAMGRLEIVNESFGDIRRKLERWYNVKIDIKDKAVENYTFTATFTHENIGEILKILQHSYYFNYQIAGNTIIISR